MKGRACTVEGCGRVHEARGWCNVHYKRWVRTGDPLELVSTWVNPLVCVCPEPLADPAIQFGRCRRCFRKPVSLFSEANQALLGQAP